MTVETEIEDDGHWIAEVPALPGAMAYAPSRAEAISKVEALVLRILADCVENGEDVLAYAGIFRDSRRKSARIMETIDRDCGQVRKEDWREAMRRLPVAEKLALLEKAITEALALEKLKSEWRKSAKSSSSLLPTAR
jgi:predicted RNase H-like HicB family nuclease